MTPARRRLSSVGLPPSSMAGSSEYISSGARGPSFFTAWVNDGGCRDRGHRRSGSRSARTASRRQLCPPTFSARQASNESMAWSVHPKPTSMSCSRPYPPQASRKVVALPLARTMQTTQAEVLRRFISDEASATLSNEIGEFWPSNHHVIKPLVQRANRLLPESERIELYFHLLRRDACPTLKMKTEFPLLVQSYERMTPLFSTGYPSCWMARTKGLFLFGTDDRGPLPRHPVVTHEEYTALSAFWRYADSFSHMPGMLKKQAKFAALAKDDALVDRALHVLTRMSPIDDLASCTCLWFWSLVLLVIQHSTTADLAVEWLLQVDLPAQDRDFYRSNLARYLQASNRFDVLENCKLLAMRPAGW